MQIDTEVGKFCSQIAHGRVGGSECERLACKMDAQVQMGCRDALC